MHETEREPVAIHLAVDEAEKDIIGIAVTTADWGDNDVLPELLAQVDRELTHSRKGLAIMHLLYRKT